MYLPGTVFQGTEWPACKRLLSEVFTEALAAHAVNGRIDCREAALLAVIETAALNVPNVGVHGNQRDVAGTRELAIRFLMEIRCFSWIIVRKLADVDLLSTAGSDALKVRLRTIVNYMLPELRSAIDRFQHHNTLAQGEGLELSFSPTNDKSRDYCNTFAHTVATWRQSDAFTRFIAGFSSDGVLSVAVTKRPDFKDAFVDFLVKALPSIECFNRKALEKLLRGSMKGAIPAFAQLIYAEPPKGVSTPDYVRAVAAAFSQALLVADWERQLDALNVPVLSDNRRRKLTEVHIACGVFSRFLGVIKRAADPVPREVREWAMGALQIHGNGRVSALTVSDLALRVEKNFLDVPPDVLLRWSALTSEFLPRLAVLTDARSQRDWATTLMMVTEWPSASTECDESALPAEQQQTSGRRRVKKRPENISASAAAFKAWDEQGNAYGLLHHPQTRISHDLVTVPQSLKAEARARTVTGLFDSLWRLESSDPRQSEEFLRADSVHGIDAHATSAQALADDIIWRDEPSEQPDTDDDRTRRQQEDEGEAEDETEAEDEIELDDEFDDDWLPKWETGADFDVDVELPDDVAETLTTIAVPPPAYEFRGAMTFPSYIAAVAQSFDRMEKLDNLLKDVDMAVRINAIARVLVGTDELAALPSSWCGQLLVWPESLASGRESTTERRAATRFPGLPSAEYLFAGVRGETFSSFEAFEAATSLAERALRGAAARSEERGTDEKARRAE